jgi:hypothetical protein
MYSSKKKSSSNTKYTKDDLIKYKNHFAEIINITKNKNNEIELDLNYFDNLKINSRNTINQISPKNKSIYTHLPRKIYQNDIEIQKITKEKQYKIHKFIYFMENYNIVMSQLRNSILYTDEMEKNMEIVE